MLQGDFKICYSSDGAVGSGNASLPEVPSEYPTATHGRYIANEGWGGTVGTVVVAGLVYDTLICYGPKGRSKEEQAMCPESVGYRLATPEENRAYLESLLEKSKADKLDYFGADFDAFSKYCRDYVMDQGTGLSVASYKGGYRHHGFACDERSFALYVRPTSLVLSTTIAYMKSVLREADCLYDNHNIWKQLGAEYVPDIPEAVIKEAYKKGGRVILQCSSISQKTAILREDGCVVEFANNAQQSDYTAISEPKWIVVPSHIDLDRLCSASTDHVYTAENPGPTTENSFAVRAYARLDGKRQPGSITSMIVEFTTEPGTVVGSLRKDVIIVDRVDGVVRSGTFFRPARFGPARSLYEGEPILTTQY